MEMMAVRIILFTEADHETGSRFDTVATGILLISNDTINGLNAAFDEIRHLVRVLRESAESTPPPAQKSVRKPV
jgi:hypothetical protein